MLFIIGIDIDAWRYINKKTKYICEDLNTGKKQLEDIVKNIPETYIHIENKFSNNFSNSLFYQMIFHLYTKKNLIIKIIRPILSSPNKYFVLLL
jgi:hypothetical protein